MLRELTYACRLLRKTPAFTALTVFVMSAGLGLTIYMFSLVNLLAYKNLDITDYDRLVIVDATDNGIEDNGGTIATHDFDYYKARQQSYGVFSAYTHYTANFAYQNLSVRYDAAALEQDALALFDGIPVYGRTFSDEDMLEGSANVAIISYQIWQEVFDLQESALETVVQINGLPTRIIGVMSQGYAYPVQQQLWSPLKLARNNRPGEGEVVTVAAKLKPGVSLSDAQAELSLYAQELAEQYPETNANTGIHSRTLVQQMMDNSMQIVYMLIGATAFILALIITNVGNLMLVRAIERRKEVAIRMALGGSREKIVMQMLMETLIICVVSGFFGIMIAGLGLDLTYPIFQGFAGWVASWWTFELGRQELLGALWIILGTALLTGLIPAIRASGANINTVLRDGTRGAQSKSAGKLSKILIVSEVFLSCTLLIFAGAMIIAMKQAINADYGIDPRGFLTARFALVGDEYTETQGRHLYHERLIETLKSQPNVVDATVGSALPGRGTGRQPYLIEGLEIQNGNYPRGYFMTVANNYFDTLDVPIVEGRAFDERDQADTQRVVIISSSLANRYWQNESAIGKRIKTNPNSEEDEWFTIVGVSQHLLHAQPFADGNMRPSIYVPNSQLSYSFQYIAIKTDSDPNQLRQMLSGIAAKVDPNVPFFEVKTLKKRLRDRVGGIAFIGQLFVIFGIFALILAAAGIYGVMSRNVLGRIHEFGIRRALGAEESTLFKMVLKQSSVLLVIGLAAGGGIGFVGIKVLSSQLVHLLPYFPAVAIVVWVLVGATFLISTSIPLREALSIEPNNALRDE
jgi:predicted permease